MSQKTIAILGLLATATISGMNNTPKNQINSNLVIGARSLPLNDQKNHENNLYWGSLSEKERNYQLGKYMLQIMTIPVIIGTILVASKSKN